MCSSESDVVNNSFDSSEKDVWDDQKEVLFLDEISSYALLFDKSNEYKNSKERVGSTRESY